MLHRYISFRCQPRESTLSTIPSQLPCQPVAMDYRCDVSLFVASDLEERLGVLLDAVAGCPSEVKDRLEPIVKRLQLHVLNYVNPQCLDFNITELEAHFWWLLEQAEQVILAGIIDVVPYPLINFSNGIDPKRNHYASNIR